MTLGVAASLAVFFTLRSLEKDVAAAEFQRRADERRQAVEGKLDIALETLESIAALFRTVDDVGREDFHEFTTPILDRHDGYIQAFGWNQRIARADRDAHVQRTRDAGFTSYDITERDADGRMTSAGDRPEYVAVSYLAPKRENEAAHGYDIASEQSRRAALDRAEAEGALAITAPIRLVQDGTGSAQGFLACIPIRAEGFVVGVFRAGDIVIEALRHFDRVPLAIRLVDDQVQDGTTLFDYKFDSAALSTGLANRTSIGRGGRAWTLEFRPTAAFMAAHRGPAPWIALLMGVLVTGLFAAYLSVVTGRTVRIERVVSERTEELTQANADLGREVARRQGVQRELRAHRDMLEVTVRERTNELVRAVGELGESDERHRMTLEAIADGAWDWNMVTNHCHFSDRWLRSLGYDPLKVPPHLDFWESIVHPDDLEGARAALIPHAEGEVPHYEFRSRVRRADGTYGKNLSCGCIVARDASGRPTRMLGTNTDITAVVAAEAKQRLMEQRLQHGQKLESLGVLAGGIAHDFNNLLVPILGGAELALMGIGDEPAQRKPLEHILLAATRASELTEQMLAYAGRNTLARERVLLPQVLDGMVELLRAARSKRAALELDVAEDVPAIEGDPTQLRQVVMNLITNASDAIGDEPGTITTRIGTTDVGADDLGSMLLGSDLEPGTYVCLEVEDTGVGMSAETRARIFDPFFTTKFQGRGLGLAAVIGIVRSHGGAIDVRSTLGEGTRFRVLLPAAGVAAEAVTPPEPVLAAVGSGTILVIDDEEPVRRVAAMMLEGSGYTPLLASDGPEGIELFRQHRRELVMVLLDMTMPQMSGTEVIVQLRDIAPTVPVVFTSGYSETDVATAVSEFGAAGFIKKPYRQTPFMAGIRAVLRRSAEAS